MAPSDLNKEQGFLTLRECVCLCVKERERRGSRLRGRQIICTVMSLVLEVSLPQFGLKMSYPCKTAPWQAEACFM